LVALLGGSAVAEPVRGSGGHSLPLPTYVSVPRAAQPTTSAVSSRIVFMKRCPLISGCTIKKGTDDVLFKRPAEGKEVQPGFKAVIDAQDDVRVEKVELVADGTVVGETTTLIGGGFEIVAPELGRGDHMLEARATDVQGVVGSQLISVTEGPPCTPDDGCTGSDVCAGGVCVPGPAEEGGLGGACQSDTECLSHRCADAGETLKHCVESCNMASSDSCPNDFSCLAAGASGGVCWPTPGGCCDAGARPHGPALLGLGVVLVLRRRRRGRARS
jgi:hypothetical protein